MRRSLLVLLAVVFLLAGCGDGHTLSGTPIGIYAGSAAGNVEAVQTAVAVMTAGPVTERGVTVYLDGTPVAVWTAIP